MAEFVYWQSVDDDRWYWHLLNDQEDIIATGGGKGSDTEEDVLGEMTEVEDAFRGRRLQATRVGDPNL